MFSHWEFEAEPEIETSKTLSIRQCRDIHDSMTFNYDGLHRSVTIGKNSFAITLEGSLRYDESSGTISCQGDRAHLHPDSKETVEQSLVFEAANLVLTEETGRRLLTGGQTVVITSGLASGLELSHLEDRQGGLVLDTVTVLTPLLNAASACPLALLRQQLELVRISDDFTSRGTVVDAISAANASSFIPKALVWSNSRVTLHQEEEIDLPPGCEAGHAIFYKSNHEGIIISSNAPPTVRTLAKNNPLDYMALSNLGQASRSDFIHNHVNLLLKNISAKIEELECSLDLEQVLKTNFQDKDKNTRMRYVASGELIYQLKCPRVHVSPGYAKKKDTPVCTHELPVHLAKNKYTTGLTVYLEPKTRFLMTSAKQVPCQLLNLAPPAFKTLAGRYIFFNGTDVVYLDEQVLEKQLIIRKYSEGQDFDISADLDTTGLETEKEVQDSALFLEYSRYVEVQERKDLAGQPPPMDEKTSSSGRQAHSWWLQAKASAEDMESRALDMTGLSGLTVILKRIQEIWAWLHPMAMLGGLCYAGKFLVYLFCSSIRLCLILYTKPNIKLRELIGLSLSSSTRTQRELKDHLDQALHDKLTKTVDQEMTLMHSRLKSQDDLME